MKAMTQSGVCAVSLSADCALAILKTMFGRIFGSSALFSDGVHSCADAFASLMTLIGALPKKDSVKKEKAERFTICFICCILFLTGAIMLISAVRCIISGAENEAPSGIALYVSAFAFAVKEGLFFFSRYASEKIGSDVLMAQAWHHRSDALSCVGSFVGILGGRLGFSKADEAASLVISFFILKAAFDILRKSIRKN